MESKNPDQFVIDKTKALGYEHHHLIPPTGHGAGGLAILWKQEVKLHVLSSNANFIDTCIEFEGKTFFAAFVHGDTDFIKRRLFWNQMVSLMNGRDAPWFITGDFNTFLAMMKKTADQYGLKGLSLTSGLSTPRGIYMTCLIRVICFLGEGKGAIT